MYNLTRALWKFLLRKRKDLKKDSNQKKKPKSFIKDMEILDQDTTCNCMLESVQLDAKPAFKLYINDLNYTLELI